MYYGNTFWLDLTSHFQERLLNPPWPGSVRTSWAISIRRDSTLHYRCHIIDHTILFSFDQVQIDLTKETALTHKHNIKMTWAICKGQWTVIKRHHTQWKWSSLSSSKLLLNVLLFETTFWYNYCFTTSLFFLDPPDQWPGSLQTLALQGISESNIHFGFKVRPFTIYRGPIFPRLPLTPPLTQDAVPLPSRDSSPYPGCRPLSSCALICP